MSGVKNRSLNKMFKSILTLSLVFGLTASAARAAEEDRLHVICEMHDGKGNSVGIIAVLQQLDISKVSGSEFLRVGMETNDQTERVPFSISFYDRELALANGQSIQDFTTMLLESEPREKFEGTADNWIKQIVFESDGSPNIEMNVDYNKDGAALFSRDKSLRVYKCEEPIIF